MQFKKALLSFALFAITTLQSVSSFALSNEETLLEARAAYDKKNELALSAHLQMLQSQNYLLAPYADYWLMLLRLNESDNTTISSFISRYAEYPFADRVRGEWLKKLAKSQDWSTFLAEYPNFKRDDSNVTCYAFQAKAAQPEATSLAEALAEAKPLWFSNTDQPESCDPVFSLMFNKGILTEADAWKKFRAALADNKLGLAKEVSRRLNQVDANKLKLLDRVAQNPQLALQKNIIPTSNRFGRELAIYAIDRSTRKDFDIALGFWKKVAPNFSGDELNYGWSRIAIQAAKIHDSRSLEFYELAKNTELDSEQTAWKVRAALRDKKWDIVQSTIATMSPTEQEVSTWRYWMGRALKEQGNVSGANAVLVKISQEPSYYGLLAKEELGDVISGAPINFQVSEAEIAAVASLPGIQRALALYKLDMRAEAKQEWANVANIFDDRALIAAAEVASRSDWLDVAINTADKTKFTHNFNLRYPTPHEKLMKAYTAENQLDEAWVYGLIRQESRFISVAKSKVGASGLMQVMPATAKWIAKRLGMKSYEPAMIHELDTNIQFGTHYLRYTMDQMNGQAVMATAAYNAGPGRPKRWAAAEPLDAAIYAETIPLSETRDYVKKVMANAQFYAERLGIAKQTLKQRIGLIPAYASATSNLSESE